MRWAGSIWKSASPGRTSAAKVNLSTAKFEHLADSIDFEPAFLIVNIFYLT